MGVNQAPDIKGQRVILRKPKDSDIDDRFRLGRVPEIVRMYGGDTRDMPVYTLKDAREWLDSILLCKYGWVIEFKGICIGSTRLTVDESNKRARYAIGIQDISKMGLGLGTEATKLVLSFAFNTLQLHRVDLIVLEYNRRAIACYQKCGFVREGRFRESALVEDHWETDILMGILADEYKNF